jgi:hypothetical protein
MRDVDSLLHVAFVEAFRLPFSVFLVLVEEARVWGLDSDSKRGSPIPLERKVLAVLFMLGQGCTAAACAAGGGSGISRSSIAAFFVAFVDKYIEHAYDSDVYTPRSAAELERAVEGYRRMGMAGCSSSMDGVHVAWHRAPAAQHTQTVGKEGKPTLVFNVACAFNKVVVHVGSVFGGARNDQTMAHYDSLVLAMREDPMYTDFEYLMYGADGREQAVQGSWVLVDGGYGYNPTLLCAPSQPITALERMLAKQMGSIRKDIGVWTAVRSGELP